MKAPLHTPYALVLARELLRHHEQACRQNGVHKSKEVTDETINRSVISYGTLCDRAGIPFLTQRSGRFLGEIAEWCYKNRWPPLNALAVREDTRMPGQGYEGTIGCSLLRWPDDIRKCIAFARYPASYSIRLASPSVSSAKRASSRRRASTLLTPGGIARTLGSSEYIRLAEIVEEAWGQAFGVVKVRRLRNNLAVEIELEDETHHNITLPKESLNV
jgi:hypothetical protein